MQRENKYIITIIFSNKEKGISLYSGDIPYYGSTSFRDNIEILSDKITIIAKRSAKVSLDSIFYNYKSSLYMQIIKCLIYYYAALGKFFKIKSIEISREKNGKILNTKKLNNNEFNQVLDKTFNLSYIFNRNNLNELFNETSKGHSMLIAISYILKAKIEIDKNIKFEKLWKAFNKLFAFISKRPKDFECLVDLRNFTLTNPGILSFSISKINALTKDELRNSIRWREMILNNYDTQAKTEAFRDFILRYNDIRMMNILLDTHYGYREDFLRNTRFFNEVDSHIKTSIAANVLRNDEVICFLVCKYMYFVRNKSFHGEKIDPSFHLIENKEEKELTFLSDILEAYLVDLINANHLY